MYHLRSPVQSAAGMGWMPTGRRTMRRRCPTPPSGQALSIEVRREKARCRQQGFHSPPSPMTPHAPKHSPNVSAMWRTSRLTEWIAHLSTIGSITLYAYGPRHAMTRSKTSLPLIFVEVPSVPESNFHSTEDRCSGILEVKIQHALVRHS